MTRKVIAPLMVAALMFCGAGPTASAQGRRRPPPDEPARFHRVYQARIREARTAAQVEGIASEIEKTFPESARPAAAPLPAEVEQRYESDPEGTYHAAPPPLRAGLDRRLWADATTRSLELQVDASPQDAQEIARKAKGLLSDRAGLADRLLVRGLEAAARKDIGGLRQGDIEFLAREYEKDPTQAGRARDLKRRWLDDQREHRLSPSDAEGRVILAGQYQVLLRDAATAATLLQEAVRIDPQSQAAVSALEALGYRKVGDRWALAEAAPPAAVETAPGPSATIGEPADSLKGLTGEEVRRKLGKPDRIARVATQGRVAEQWIYPGDNRNQYVIFVRRDGRGEPVVVDSFVHP